MNALEENPYLLLAQDIHAYLEDQDPEIVVETLALLLGHYILQCEYPKKSAVHAQKILLNSLNLKPQGN